MLINLVNRKLLRTCCFDVSFQGGHATECVSWNSTTNHRTAYGFSSGLGLLDLAFSRTFLAACG